MPDYRAVLIIVGFVVLMILYYEFYKNSEKKFRGEIMTQYPLKAGFGDAYVTENGEILFYYAPDWTPGYKKWNLSDIAYIATFYSGEFCFLDKDGKAMRGEYITSPKYAKKKNSRGAKHSTLPMGKYKTNDFVSFVKRYGPHIQHTIDGKIV